MQLHVLHETRYDYAPTVQTARHLAHLRPADTATQRVLAHRLTITPEPVHRSDSVDAFGYTRSFFSLPFAHDGLCVVAESTVATTAPVAPTHSAAWDSVAERLRYHRDTRYDPVADFVPVHAMSETPLMLVINPSRPFKTVPELIAYAKANPGKLNYGSAGPGTGTHLTAELFQTAAGIKMTHVPYRGSAPALTDLMAGSIDLMFDYPAVVLPQMLSIRVGSLASPGTSRIESRRHWAPNANFNAP